MTPSVEALYRLSPAQQWVLDRLDAAPCAPGHQQVILALEGRINVSLLHEAYRTVCASHEALRSVVWIDREKHAFQLCLGSVSCDFQALTVPSGEMDPTSLAAADHAAPFALATGPLVRCRLVKARGTQRSLLLLSASAVVADARSLRLVAERLFTAYRLIIDGEPVPDEAARAGEPERCVAVGSLEYDGVRKEWERNAKRSDAAGTPGHDASPAPHAMPEAATETWTADRELRRELQAIARRASVDEAVVLHCLWGAVLQNFANSNEVAYQYRRAGAEPTIGSIGQFTDTVALPFEDAGQASFIDVVRTHASRIAEAQPAAGATTASQLAISSLITTDGSSQAGWAPLRDGLEELGITSVGIHPHDPLFQPLRIDFTLADTLTAAFTYDPRRLPTLSVRELRSHLAELAVAIVRNPSLSLGTVEVARDPATEAILAAGGSAQPSGLSARSIPEAFAQTVAKHADRIAVASADGSLTYGELNRRSDALADRLRRRGVQPGELVALVCHRSVEMVIAWIGILKTGAAYLPIDPQYPSARIQQIVADSSPALALVDADCDDSLPEGLPTMALRPAAAADPAASVVTTVDVGPNDLAYVMFTSGSTGKPNGVLVEQQSVVRLVRATNYIQFGVDDRVLPTGSPAFDASTFEIWGPLLNGGSVFLAPNNVVLDAEALGQTIARERITVLWLTAALFNQLLDENPALFGPLRYLIAGGDALSARHVNEVKKLHPRLTVVNGYGPTENTTFSTTYTTGAETFERSVPIGSPISQSTTYVLDRHGRVQIAGWIGELHVGGLGLARGYMNRPELTAERFAMRRVAGRPERLYRSGDLVRWNDRGQIVYEGRQDFQVKVRGYRIELGEIEQAILRHPAVTNAVVRYVDAKTAAARLCAYYCTDSDLAAADLRQFLADSLPPYMIPAHLLALPALPLTCNGKIDAAALPVPAADGHAVATATTGECGLEAEITAIWRELLHVNSVRPDDGFFDLGGNSLVAARLVSRARKRYKVSVPLAEFFEEPTVAGLCRIIRDRRRPDEHAQIQSAPTLGRYPVSPQQRRLFVFQELNPESVAYNVPVIFAYRGTLDLGRMQSALQAVVQAHESLRTTYVFEGGEPVQVVHPSVEVAFDVVAADGPPQPYVQQFIRPFHLGQLPALRTAVITTGPQSGILCLDLHHIGCDGQSIAVILRDLATAYNGQAVAAPALQYKDYVFWRRQGGDRSEHERNFWLAQFSDGVRRLDLPTDFPRPARQTFDSGLVESWLDQDLTTRVESFCRERQITPYMLFLTAFYVLLRRHTGQGRFCIGTVVENRPNSDLDQTVGFFANTLAIPFDAAELEPFDAILTRCAAKILACFDHQAYPIDDLVKELNLPRDMSRGVLFDAMFAYDHQGSQRVTFDGLEFASFAWGKSPAKCELSLSVAEFNGQRRLSLNYADRLFHRSRIEGLMRAYREILDAVVTRPGFSLRELGGPAQLRDARTAHAPAATEGRPRPSLRARLDETFRLHRDQVAVSCGDARLTYRELDDRTAKLSAHLRQAGVGRDVIVALMMPRSLELAIAILAVARAGGVYLPIDNEYPLDRVKHLLRDSNADHLLTSQRSRPIPADFSGTVIRIDELAPAGEAPSPEMGGAESDNASVYVIYTSGSTGKPKGAIIREQSLLGMVAAHDEIFGRASDRRCSQVASPGFDAMVFEFWPCLLAGAELCIPPDAIVADPARMQEWLIAEKIAVTFQSTAMAERLLALPWPEQGLALTAFRTAGDVLKSLPATKPPFTLYNLYGTTEDTVWATSKVIEIGSPITIGSPIGGRKALVLDADLLPVPPGTAGELCVGGDGLAVGYLNQPELTAAKFVSNPRLPAQRLYRTGDSVRQLPNGELEIIGRIDRQVKIRGYRIELGEIETALVGCAGVTEAVVLVQATPAGEKLLCAYYTASRELPKAEVREALIQKLPRYMIPAELRQLPELPLDQHGKVDRTRLARMHEVKSETPLVEEPVNPVERDVVEIWKRVLGRAAIGVNESFFDLGGNSILLLDVKKEVLARFGLELELLALYEAPTAKALAQRIESSRTAATAERGELARPRAAQQLRNLAGLAKRSRPANPAPGA